LFVIDPQRSAWFRLLWRQSVACCAVADYPPLVEAGELDLERVKVGQTV
jgi:hypothetical protein